MGDQIWSKKNAFSWTWILIYLRLSKNSRKPYLQGWQCGRDFSVRQVGVSQAQHHLGQQDEFFTSYVFWLLLLPWKSLSALHICPCFRQRSPIKHFKKYFICFKPCVYVPVSVCVCIWECSPLWGHKKV